VLRRVSDELRDDAKVLSAFSVLAHPVSFHSEDLRKVFIKYLARVETMVGNEIAAQLMQDLRIREVETLGTLRKLKQKRKIEIVGSGKKDVGEGTGKQKKNRRRKRKNW